jgi:hypothetical protein
MQSTQMQQQIHIKVKCGEDFRRFLLLNCQYSELANQIRTLFGIDQSEKLVIKYTDEEGDMVTVSSDEELKLAADLFSGKLLKLNITSPALSHDGNIYHPEPVSAHPHCGRGQWKVKWEAKMQSDPQLRAKVTERLQSKVQKLKERKQFLENKNVTHPNPSFPHRINFITMKLQKIEGKLNHINSLSLSTPSAPASEPISPVSPIVPVPSAPAECSFGGNPHWKERRMRKWDHDACKERKMRKWDDQDWIERKMKCKEIKQQFRDGVITKQEAIQMRNAMKKQW